MRRALRWIAVAGIASVLAGCPRNIAQDSQSGKDSRYKGAVEIELEDGEGRSKKDIVTYPGGDRVDWKYIEIPEDQYGTLQIKTIWSPPRPGLDLAFNVYDGYLEQVAAAKPTAGEGKRTKNVTIEGARGGRYYVQVYAPERGDAAEYFVMARFKEGDAPAEGDESAKGDDIPNPPTLPAVPEGGEVAQNDPPDGNGGGESTGGDPTGGNGGGAGDDDGEDEIEEAIEPIKAKVVNYQVTSGGVLITLNKGASAGVERGWKGMVLRGSSDSAMDGGEVAIIKTTNSRSVGKVEMSVDQIKANRYVLLSP